MIRQRRNIFQGGTTCNYNQTVLEEALLRLQDENFITIAKIQNIQLFERAIVSQYSPDDLLNYFKQYCQREDGVPSLVMEVYHSAIFHPE